MADKQFKYIIPGVDGAGDQVFQGDTREELIAELGKAQENATGKIRQLTRDNPLPAQPPPAPVAAPAAPEPLDPRTQFFTNWYTNPENTMLGILEQRMGMPVDTFRQDYQKTRQRAENAERNEVSATFAQNHPELLQVSREDERHNTLTISQIVTENNWSWTPQNLEAAYAIGKTQGKLKLPVQSPYPEVTLPQVPTTLSRPNGKPAVNSAAVDHFLQTAPLDKVRKFIEENPD